MLYVIEGTDHRGRRFRGVYDETDARYLLASDCLNKVVDTIHPHDTISASTNERTN